MPDSNNELFANISAMQSIGSVIQKDATNLQSHLQQQWGRFKSFAFGSEVPTCLKNDFSDFANLHQPELTTLAERRQRIGQELGQAADLITFQDQLVKKSFADINIYKENNYYTDMSKMNVDNLQPPTGFNHGGQHK